MMVRYLPDRALTILVLLIRAIKPGGRFTKQFFSDTRVTSARTAGAMASTDNDRRWHLDSRSGVEKRCGMSVLIPVAGFRGASAFSRYGALLRVEVHNDPTYHLTRWRVARRVEASRRRPESQCFFNSPCPAS